MAFFKELVREKPVAVRFIEYMPSHRCRVSSGMSVQTVTEHLKNQAANHLAPPSQSPYGCGPAHYLQGVADQGVFGFIAPISECFCDRCNRIRLTADGRLRPCLLSDAEMDLRAVLRRNAADDEIVELFRQAVRSKPSSHHLAEEEGQAFKERGMSQIGG